MKTIKIFLASSEELKPEREMMASLANSLNTIFEKQDIQVIVVEWENLNDSMGVLHKQEEYNEKLRTCDICMTLFWSKFGKYTKEELDTAYQQLKEGKNPQKLYVYFKECEYPSVELQQFRDSFPQKYGHFPTHFSNLDTLKANFLQQFMIYQNEKIIGSNIIEVRNGKITVNGVDYVDLRNLPFVGNNEEYNDLKEQIEDLEEWLDDHNSEHPKFAGKQDKLEKLQVRLEKMEHGLWDTALMITKLANTKCSERLHKAMSLFSEGDNKGCNALLSEEDIDNDVEKNIERIEIGNKGKEGLKINIEEYHLKAMSIINTGQYSKENENEISRLYEKVIKFCSYINDENLLVRKVLIFLDYLCAIKRYEKGIKIINNVISLINNKSNAVQILQIKGTFLLENGQLADSVIVYESLLPDYRELFNNKKLFNMIEFPRLLCNLGIAYLADGKINDSIIMCKESIECFSILHEDFNYSNIYALSVISEAYIRLENYDSAYTYIQEAENKLKNYAEDKRTLIIRLSTIKILIEYLNCIQPNQSLQKKNECKRVILASIGTVVDLCNEIRGGDGIHVGSYKISTKIINHELFFYEKVIPILITLDLNYDIPSLLSKASTNLMALKNLGNTNLEIEKRLSIDIVRLGYYLLINDIHMFNVYAKLVISQLYDFTNNKKTISQTFTRCIDYLLFVLTYYDGLKYTTSDICDIINQSIFSNDIIKQRMILKSKIVKLFDMRGDKEYHSYFLSVYSEFNEIHNLSTIGFEDYFSFVIADFLNESIYHVLLANENYDLSLEFIDKAIRLKKSMDHNLLDTKAEVLCRISKKDEALSYAMQVYNIDSEFYPDGNEYLYQELMVFDDWKKLFVK